MPKTHFHINSPVVVWYLGITIVMFIVMTISNDNGGFITDHQILLNIIGIICLLSFVFCGFLLKPIDKKTILSVAYLAAILGAIMILFLLISRLFWPEFGFFYYDINPALRSLVGLLPLQGDFGDIRSTIFYLSPLIPSLLMYLGMLLRCSVIGVQRLRSQPRQR